MIDVMELEQNVLEIKSGGSKLILLERWISYLKCEVFICE